MKMLSFLSRYRLLVNILTLALALGALAYSPPAAVADPGWICETSCVNWNVYDGCVQYMTCCVNDNGGWFCTAA